MFMCYVQYIQSTLPNSSALGDHKNVPITNISNNIDSNHRGFLFRDFQGR